jgi:GxxExxY protein
MNENEIARIVVDCAFRVHTTLGPGLLEHIYEVALQHELKKRGLEAIRQVPQVLIYDDIQFDDGFRIDLLVENKVVVEVKTVEEIHPRHRLTVNSYLRLADKRLGLLINFNVALIKDGITRIANRMPDDPPTPTD